MNIKEEFEKRENSEPIIKEAIRYGITSDNSIAVLTVAEYLNSREITYNEAIEVLESSLLTKKTRLNGLEGFNGCNFVETAKSFLSDLQMSAPTDGNIVGQLLELKEIKNNWNPCNYDRLNLIRCYNSLSNNLSMYSRAAVYSPEHVINKVLPNIHGQIHNMLNDSEDEIDDINILFEFVKENMPSNIRGEASKEDIINYAKDYINL